jgi:alpha-D-xyloside xylohydrolase
MQIGTSSNDVAWEPTPENGFDEEMLDWYREYTRLHLRLFPYEWTYAQRIAVDGRPIQRALGLAYPELGVHPDDTYMFGDNLLVAPVVDRGARSREVILPPGRWFDWWTGQQVYEGEQTITVDAPLETLPLFVRAGSIVPMLRPTIDTMSPTTAPDLVDSYATTAGPLHVRLAPGPSSSFEVFDGTEIRHSPVGYRTTIVFTEGTEFRFGARFEIQPSYAFFRGVDEVTDNGQPLQRVTNQDELDALDSGWFVAATAGTIKVGPGDHEIRLQ